MKQYKHIFFDLDRTLWDLEKNSSDTLCDIIIKFSLQDSIKEPENFVKLYSHYNELLWEEYRQRNIKKHVFRFERFRLLLKHYGIENDELAQKINRFYINTNPTKPGLVKDALPVVTYLSKKYSLYIISNGFYDVQLTKIKNSGLSRYFAKLFTSDIIGYAKPHPKIFEHAITSVNARKTECLMIGDDFKNDIQGAMDINMDQVFYNPDKLEILPPPIRQIRQLSELKDFL